MKELIASIVRLSEPHRLNNNGWMDSSYKSVPPCTCGFEWKPVDDWKKADVTFTKACLSNYPVMDFCYYLTEYSDDGHLEGRIVPLSVIRKREENEQVIYTVDLDYNTGQGIIIMLWVGGDFFTNSSITIPEITAYYKPDVCEACFASKAESSVL